MCKRISTHTHTHTHTHTINRVVWIPISLFWPHSRQNRMSPLPLPLVLLWKTPPTLTWLFPDRIARWAGPTWRNASTSPELAEIRREQWKPAVTNTTMKSRTWKLMMMSSLHHLTWLIMVLVVQATLGTSYFSSIRITARPTLVHGGREASWWTQETRSKRTRYELSPTYQGFPTH